MKNWVDLRCLWTAITTYMHYVVPSRNWGPENYFQDKAI